MHKTIAHAILAFATLVWVLGSSAYAQSGTRSGYPLLHAKCNELLSTVAGGADFRLLKSPMSQLKKLVECGA